jgi:hypothetical protein
MAKGETPKNSESAIPELINGIADIVDEDPDKKPKKKKKKQPENVTNEVVTNKENNELTKTPEQRNLCISLTGKENPTKEEIKEALENYTDNRDSDNNDILMGLNEKIAEIYVDTGSEEEIYKLILDNFGVGEIKNSSDAGVVSDAKTQTKVEVETNPAMPATENVDAVDSAKATESKNKANVNEKEELKKWYEILGEGYHAPDPNEKKKEGETAKKETDGEDEDLLEALKGFDKRNGGGLVKGVEKGSISPEPPPIPKSEDEFKVPEPVRASWLEEKSKTVSRGQEEGVDDIEVGPQKKNRLTREQLKTQKEAIKRRRNTEQKFFFENRGLDLEKETKREVIEIGKHNNKAYFNNEAEFKANKVLKNKAKNQVENQVWQEVVDVSWGKLSPWSQEHVYGNNKENFGKQFKTKMNDAWRDLDDRGIDLSEEEIFALLKKGYYVEGFKRNWFGFGNKVKMQRAELKTDENGNAKQVFINEELSSEDFEKFVGDLGKKEKADMEARINAVLHEKYEVANQKFKKKLQERRDFKVERLFELVLDDEKQPIETLNELHSLVLSKGFIKGENGKRYTSASVLALASTLEGRVLKGDMAVSEFEAVMMRDDRLDKRFVSKEVELLNKELDAKRTRKRSGLKSKEIEYDTKGKKKRVKVEYGNSSLDEELQKGFRADEVKKQELLPELEAFDATGNSADPENSETPEEEMPFGNILLPNGIEFSGEEYQALKKEGYDPDQAHLNSASIFAKDFDNITVPFRGKGGSSKQIPIKPEKVAEILSREKKESKKVKKAKPKKLRMDSKPEPIPPVSQTVEKESLEEKIRRAKAALEAEKQAVKEEKSTLDDIPVTDEVALENRESENSIEEDSGIWHLPEAKNLDEFYQELRSKATLQVPGERTRYGIVRERIKMLKERIDNLKKEGSSVEDLLRTLDNQKLYDDIVVDKDLQQKAKAFLKIAVTEERIKEIDDRLKKLGDYSFEEAEQGEEIRKLKEERERILAKK